MHILNTNSTKLWLLFSLVIVGCKQAGFASSSSSRIGIAAATTEKLPVQTELTAEDKELKARMDQYNEEQKASEVKVLALNSVLESMSGVSTLLEGVPKTDESLGSNQEYLKTLSATAITIINGVSLIEKVATVANGNADEVDTSKQLSLLDNAETRQVQLTSQGQSPIELLAQASNALNGLLLNQSACVGGSSFAAAERGGVTLTVNSVVALLNRILFGFDGVMKTCLAKLTAPTECKIEHKH